jgi:RNA polymerase sigma-70 factor (ECF subfamily)
MRSKALGEAMEHDIRQFAEQDHAAEQVRRCITGDALAWEGLFGSYSQFIYYLCWNYTGSRNNAEDLAQEIFLKLFCNLSRYDSEKGSLKTWIQNITRNHLVDSFRRSKLARASDSLDAGLSGEGSPISARQLTYTGASPEQCFASLETKTRIHAALCQLPAGSRDVIVLCDLEEWDYREAAEILGVPVGTVKSRLSRGRIELARLLSPKTNAVCVSMEDGKLQATTRKANKEKARTRFGRDVACQTNAA